MAPNELKNKQDVGPYKIKVRELNGNDGMLKGAGQIAGYLLGDRSLSTQIEEAARVGSLPHFRLNGELCATKTALELYAYRLLGGAEPRGRKEWLRRHGKRRMRRGGVSVSVPFRCALSRGKILALTPEGKVVLVSVVQQGSSALRKDVAA